MAGEPGRINLMGEVIKVDESDQPTVFGAANATITLFAGSRPVLIVGDAATILVESISAGLVSLSDIKLEVGEDYLDLTLSPTN